jgi:hypothetical protein
VARILIETNARPEKIDHLWLDLRAGSDGVLRVSLSTCSRQSRAAGFDPRVWLGIVESTWSELPVAGVAPARPLNYSAFESMRPIDYLPYERRALEQLLTERSGRAIFAEAWGSLYLRGRPGVHQIHSRRASFAVPTDRSGEDGALQFFYEEGVCEMLLFKFAGQP